MAGHSKWKQIKHKKAASDAKKGQLFSKLVREITVAARVGGDSPEANPRLKAAMDRAREFGMPKENIERALERASGAAEGENLEEFLYEAALGSIQILIEGITDNKNRTLNEVRQTLLRHNAKLVPQNSFLWNFEKTWTNKGKEYKPRATMKISEEEQEKITILTEELERLDDIQEVYTNLTRSMNQKS